jgi:cellulose synthase operon protein C
MSTASPGEAEKERGSEQNSRPVSEAGTPEGAAPTGDPDEAMPSETRGADPLQAMPQSETASDEPLIAAACVTSPEQDIALFEDEALADAQSDPRRVARLLHEVAQIRERRLGLVRDAGKTYKQSLTCDPTLQANTWALFRLFLGRGFWENLARLLDAEIRFAALPGPADRADLLVEKGRLLEDRLGRPTEALACYRSALQAAPDHPAALLALLCAGLRTGAQGDAEEALADLVARTPDPRLRAHLAVELARLQRGALVGGGDPERIRRAADGLLKALLGPVAQEPLLAELDRLSVVADSSELRARVLDVFDSRLSREDSDIAQVDSGFAVAVYREKARLLQRRGARDAALAVLERALRTAPIHPLLVTDYLDLAEEAGRPDAIAGLIEGPLAQIGGRKLEEALLRRAESAARSGALGEAIGALDRISPESRFAPLAALARVRILARLGDAEGLVQAFSAEAARMLEVGDGANGHARKLPREREAAHFYVRAATARREFLNDPRGAEADLRRAIALFPDYPPAIEGLRAVLAELGDWRSLATLFEEEATRTTDEERRRVLHQSLATLHRDLLRNPKEAQRFESPPKTDDLRTAARAADRAGQLYVATGEAAADVVERLCSLAERVTDPSVAAALRLQAARVAAEEGHDSGAVINLLEEATRQDPGSLAAATLEQEYRRAGRTDDLLRLLGDELRAADEAGRIDAARALRFRQAFCAAEARRYEEALKALAPLRQQRDLAAVLWSLDLARSAGQAALEAAVLSEPAVAATLESESPNQATARAERLVALAEAREHLGENAAASEAFAQALALGERTLIADAALGLLRIHVQAGGRAEILQAFGQLAETMRGYAPFEQIRREADLLLLGAGLPGASAETGISAFDGTRQWLRGLRAGAAEQALDGLAVLAQASAPEGASELWATIGLRRRLGGHPQSWADFTRALDAGLTPLLSTAASDLAGPGPLAPALSAARRERAERLCPGDGPSADLAEALLLEEAADAETLGRAQAAAAAYARALQVRPNSLEAIEGLRRIARAAGNRSVEIPLLLRRGALLREPHRAAQCFAEAALLLEDEGREEDAAPAFMEVLRRAPEDDEAYQRLHDILARRDDPTGLERLLTLKIQTTPDPRAQIALLDERARIRLTRLDRRREAIHDHRRILELDPGRVESLRLLAALAAESHRFVIAAQLLERAIEQTADDVEAGAIRLDLASAYDQAGLAERAASVLRVATDAHPEDPVPRERLIDLALRRRHFDLAVEQLQALGALAETPAEKAALAVRLGRVERDERQDRERALAAFREALIVDPLSEAAAELVKTLAGGPLAPDDASVVNAAIVELRRALADDPLHVLRLECLRDLARLRGLTDLGDAAGQLLTALGVGVVERGRSRDLSRPLSLGTLAALGAAREGGGGQTLLAEVWPHLADAVARLFGADPAATVATRHNRVSPGTEPRLAWAEAASLALGIPTLSVHVVGLDDSASIRGFHASVIAQDAPEPRIVLGSGVVGGEPVSRFRTGRALALLRLKATLVERVSLEELELIWAAAAWLAGSREQAGRWDSSTVKAKAKNIAKGLSRRQVKAVESYGGRFAAEARDVVAWRQGLLRAANRFGLLVAGDLASALQALTGAIVPTNSLAAGMDPSQSSLGLRGPECTDLIRFALSDRYAAVRREAGLSTD